MYDPMIFRTAFSSGHIVVNYALAGMRSVFYHRAFKKKRSVDHNIQGSSNLTKHSQGLSFFVVLTEVGPLVFLMRCLVCGTDVGFVGSVTVCSIAAQIKLIEIY